jgi:tripartite-type tricarboxylate transporter receptor subunit TctC
LRAYLFVLSIFAVLSGAALAETYPSHPVRIVVPFPAGGIADLSARLVAEGLRQKFNQPVIVENKVGGNGVLGLHDMLRAEPDGYTLMMGSVGAVVISIVMDSNPPFDPARDLKPIANVAAHPMAMVVNNAMPVNSVKDFVAYAKARPGKLSYGSTGVGTLDFVSAQLLMKETGISMVHVPYKGGPYALNDLMNGSIDVIVEVFPVVMGQIQAHTIRGLAVTGAERQPSLPDVPTFAEAGLPGIDLTGWIGLFGPPRMPEDVRQMLGAAIAEIVKQPGAKEKFNAIGFEPVAQNADAFAAYYAAEIKRWTDFTNEMDLRK